MSKANKHWDQLIRALLEDYRLDHARPDWNRMHKLLQSYDDDELFDQSIRNKLLEIKADTPAATWLHYKSRRQRKVHLFISRAIEFALVFLVLWTYGRQTTTEVVDKSHAVNQSVAPPAYGHDRPSMQTLSDFTAAGKGLAVENDPNTEKPIKRKNLLASGPTNPTTTDHASSTDEPFKQTMYYTAIRPSQNQNDDQNPAPFDDLESTVKNQPTYRTAALSEPAELFDHHELSHLPLSVRAELFSAAKNKTPIANLEANTPAISRPRSVPSTPNFGKRQILLFGGMMLNQISAYPPTSYRDGHPMAKNRSVRQPAAQPTIGVHLNFKSFPFLLESGLSFSRYSYNPQIKTIYSDLHDCETQLEFQRFTFFTANIPVLLLRHLYNDKNSNIWAKAGLSLSASLKNHYEVSQSYLTSRNRTEPISEVSLELQNINNSLPKINLYEGLLDQGDIYQNSFINLVLGLRLVHTMCTGKQFFADVDYFQMLGQQGFGPRNERFHGLQIKLGSMIKL